MNSQLVASSKTFSTRQRNRMSLGVVILGISALALMYWAGQADILKFVYPALMLIVGAWLYTKHTTAYVGFVFWVWALTPFIRRLLDYQIGQYVPLNPAMTAPLLVSALTIFSLIRYGNLLMKKRYFPFLLAILGIAYGFAVGVLNNGLMGSTLGLLSWLLPVATGFHVLVLWEKYPAHRRIISSTLTWLLLITGAYGIVQFFAPFPWDAMWMVGSEMQSIGSPEPFDLRVFGTLNSPGPYAFFVMSGLILLLGQSGLLTRVATGFGVGGFLLSLVRSAWGGFVAGLGYLVVRSRGRARKRFAAILAASVFASVPLFFFQPVTQTVDSRMESMSNIEQDNSYQSRVAFTKIAAGWVLRDPVGKGLGSIGSASKVGSSDRAITSFDNGFLHIPFALGWLGAGVYYAALFMLGYRMLRIDSSRKDLFAVASGGIVIALFSVMIFLNSCTGLSGIFLWTFLGIVLASGRFHNEQSS